MFLYNLQILFFMHSIYFNLYPVLFHFFSKVRLILKAIVILNISGCQFIPIFSLGLLSVMAALP